MADTNSTKNVWQFYSTYKKIGHGTRKRAKPFGKESRSATGFATMDLKLFSFLQLLLLHSFKQHTKGAHFPNHEVEGLFLFFGHARDGPLTSGKVEVLRSSGPCEREVLVTATLFSILHEERCTPLAITLMTTQGRQVQTSGRQIPLAHHAPF